MDSGAEEVFEDVKKSMQQSKIKKPETWGVQNILRELKGEVNIPVSRLLGRNRRERFARLVYLSLFIFIICFLINAAIVSTALWMVSKTKLSELTIHKVALSHLESPIAQLSIEAEVSEKWYFKLFNIIIHKPTIIRLYVPEAVRRSEDKWLPVITARLPRIDVGRGGHGIALDAIPIEIHHTIPLQNLIEYFIDAEEAQAVIQVGFQVETNSYWIPLRFSHSVQHTFKLPKASESVSMGLEKPKVTAIEFVEGQSADFFSIRLHINYDKSWIPNFLSVKVPELRADLGFLAGKGAPQSSTENFGQVREGHLSLI